MKQDRINEYPIRRTMKAWVLGNPEELVLVQVPTAIKYARERIEDAIKVVVKIRES
jgi:rhodanese-related sulfurtransferase